MTAWKHLANLAESYAASFQQAMRQPVETQQSILQGILSRNAETTFGKDHHFSNIKDVKGFCQAVPVKYYEEIRPWVERVADGESQVLTKATPIAFEETTGTTSKSKLIPYTQDSIEAFRQALFPWLYDLIRKRPGLSKGKLYWALSPVLRAPRLTPSGIPIGVSSDASYFGPDAARFLTELSVVPGELQAETNFETWRDRSLMHLLSARDLSFISIWSPTFLRPFLDRLEENIPLFVRRLADGWKDIPAQPDRADEIESICRNGQISSDQIWSMLDTISTWANGAAKSYIPDLAAQFSHAHIQGKGLLSTEAIISFPLIEYEHPVLALNSGFYEFLDEEEVPHLCHELTVKKSYGVMVTTPGGLYRYRTGDRVQMRGWAKPGVPLLEFIGREGNVSDICGEKLSEEFILNCLDGLQGFAALVPKSRPQPHYVVFVDQDEMGNAKAAMLRDKLDAMLSRNPHYAYAREIRQLSQLQVLRCQKPMQIYIAYMTEKAIRVGNIKPPVLLKENGWYERFMGE